jgi:hypothetical protein
MRMAFVKLPRTEIYTDGVTCSGTATVLQKVSGERNHDSEVDDQVNPCRKPLGVLKRTRACLIPPCSPAPKLLPHYTKRLREYACHSEFATLICWQMGTDKHFLNTWLFTDETTFQPCPEESGQVTWSLGQQKSPVSLTSLREHFEKECLVRRYTLQNCRENNSNSYSRAMIHPILTS